MCELFYSALDIALIIADMNPGYQEEVRLLDLIWKNEKARLVMKYRENQRKFILDIYYWLHYLFDKAVLDKEFDAMQIDLAHLNRTVQPEQLTGDFSGLGLFFKSTRIQILYGSGRSYVRIKLRTLLKQYGYKRRSSSLLQYIRGCMLFYNLEVALRNGIPCSIETVGLDRMLTFRLSSRISSS
ncbi:hypothetical protein [Johnsonella ignava]|uniref:hypothetical protein n=1 Tax=Johnsonella ignava TaxID=43995 RepID=UPI0023F0B54E|nr:hypothetical protein [Johnsonella ignava]